MQIGRNERDVTESIDRTADRARRLFQYLRDLATLRIKTVRDVDDYERVVWFSDVPAEAASSFLLDPQGDTDPDVWLRVPRVQLPQSPPVPEQLRPWIRLSNVSNGSLDEPGLVDIDEQETELPTDIALDYRRFVDSVWRSWAIEYRRLKPRYDFYTQLFTMSERKHRLGEIYEIVIGFGFLAWFRNGQSIRRHLITAPAEILVDQESGVISVQPVDAGRNRFELDMLEADDRGNPTVTRALGEEVEAADPISLGDLATTQLLRWINTAHPSGMFLPDLQPTPARPEMEVRLAPALILRKRGQRTVSDLLNDISQQLASGTPAPEGVERLVTDEEFDRGQSDNTQALVDPEIYFPLPSNEEQRQIVDRMAHQRGILVQGPPGTGKSHTIANLVAHLLAQGKRVLVTSHTERALKVLRAKLPEEIQPLCIALLGNDRDSIRELENSVEEISTRQADWSEIDAQQRVDRIRSRLADYRSRAAEVANELRLIRESETHTVSIGTYRGTRQQIAMQLAEQREDLSWIPDVAVSEQPPISSLEFAQLLDLVATLDDEATAAAEAELPDPDQMTSPSRLQQIAGSEMAILNGLEAARRRYGSEIDNLIRSQPEALHRAANALSELNREIATLVRQSPWASAAVADCLDERRAVWETLMTEARGHEKSADGLTEAFNVQLEAPKHLSIGSLRAVATDLLGHVRAGGKIKGGPLAPKVVKTHRPVLENVRLDGMPLTQASHFERLLKRLDLDDAIEGLASSWGNRVTRPEGTIPQRLAVYRQESATLGRVLGLSSLKESAVEALASLPVNSRVLWSDSGSLVEHESRFQAALDAQNIDNARADIARAKEAVGEDRHWITRKLRDAIDQRDHEAYREGLGALHRHRDLAKRARHRNELRGRLKLAAPSLAAVISVGTDPVWTARANRLEAAWMWKFASMRLAELSDPHRTAQLSAEETRLIDNQLNTLGELAATLSWQRMFASLKTPEAQALAAWAQAVKKIGKGTGKYAENHRRTARTYMDKARDAIPAWIMPMYRVAESVRATPEIFDVVIVDEASQSGVESLFLFYLGKRVIVVGDDQQIAPEAVGIDRLQVNQLRQQYIEDLPFSELFGPDDSLFSQASVRFPGRIVLREHFRCMPEIIQFSNQIAYTAKSLIPLRQYGADRLDPIRTVHLLDGFREGTSSKAMNRREAQEIVDRISKLITDPQYDRKTFGVISLQGSYQAYLIEQMLLEHLGSQTMLEREIICGDAYAFQGDERDVMFLSMVAAPNAQIGALSKEQDKRRFNVAASRAKDQAWLIHSVRPEDLSPSDMRRALLGYYLDPKVDTLAELAEFDPSVLNAPFESRFEQDVYLQIRERGFRVIPQVLVAGHRIDLVVEGMQGRLAVECDGDEWHGPEQWDADMARQRKLERCGWAFVRIRGSEFYFDQNQALQPLWKQLERRGITPGTMATPSALTETAPLIEDLAQQRPAGSGSTNGFRLDKAVPGTEEATTDTSPEESRATVLGLGVGNRVMHPRKGEATVIRVFPDGDDDDPAVSLRFDNGEDYEYAEWEYEAAHFESIQEIAGIQQIQPPDSPPASPSSGRLPSSAVLSTYDEWEGTGLPDPRVKRGLAEHMFAIIDVEGPATSDRIYRLMVKGAGFDRVTKPVRSNLNQVLYSIRGQTETVELVSPATNWPQRVVRPKERDAVLARERGPRELYEIPLDEVAAAFGALKSTWPMMSIEGLKREILSTYELVRLTERVDQYLEAALRLVRTNEP